MYSSMSLINNGNNIGNTFAKKHLWPTKQNCISVSYWTVQFSLYLLFKTSPFILFSVYITHPCLLFDMNGRQHNIAQCDSLLCTCDWSLLISFPSQIFGPVQCIFSFKSQQEAIERANNSQYGLVSAVFTTSMDRALSVSGVLETGTVW